MFLFCQMEDILLKLERLPYLKVERNPNGFICTADFWCYDIYFNDEYIGFYRYSFTDPDRFEYAIDGVIRGECDRKSPEAEEHARKLVDILQELVLKKSKKIDKERSVILERLEDLREIVPERFQDCDPDKFMQKIREYILCLQFRENQC